MNTKKIFLSLSIIFGVAALAYGGTQSFFSDSETSTGNTFTAGEIDLKIDNTSYYNGAVSTSTSWELRDLTIEKFFDFNDVKPGDQGEDTISLHVNNNDSWLCVAVKLTSDDENNRNTPETKDGDVTDGPGNGELADQVNFIWWADDGDNVLEDNESSLPGGPIGALGVGDEAIVPLADSQTNIWGDQGPMPASSTRYIGKAWCFGAISEIPLAQDGQGAESNRTPANSTGGIACDGSNVNNTAQSDSLTANVTFTAIQARSNLSYRCIPGEIIPPPPVEPITTGNLTVTKLVENSSTTPASFSLFVHGVSVTSGVATTTSATTLQVLEIPVPHYTVTFGGNCTSTGLVAVPAGGSASCTITNTYVPTLPPEPVSLLSESFGTGSSANDILNWEEEGEENSSTEMAQGADASGEEIFSPDDGDANGRFAKISNDGNWICRSVNATGFNTLLLKYYWKGDTSAEDNAPDVGIVEYATGGTCDIPTGLNTQATHELDDGNNNIDEGWSSLQSIGLPGALDGTTFLIRFRNTASSGGEDFRIDGVSVTAIPN